MVTLLAPVAKAPTYVKVANFPGLYRHARSGRYYACKKQGGIRRERSLGTCDRKIAERRMKEWLGSLDKVDAEVEKTTLGQLLGCFDKSTKGASESTRVTDQSIIKRFLAWWPHGKDFQVRLIRPSMLDEWLAHEEPRLRNVTYNRYAGFLKQLFDIALKDRIIPESPAKLLRQGWKKPQAVRRQVPSVAQFEAVVADIRRQVASPHAQVTADFVEFLGLAGLGQGQGASLQGDETAALDEDRAAWLSESLASVSRTAIKYLFGEGVQPLAYVRLKTQDREDISWTWRWTPFCSAAVRRWA